MFKEWLISWKTACEKMGDEMRVIYLYEKWEGINLCSCFWLSALMTSLIRPELPPINKRIISNSLVAEVDGSTYWRNPFNSLCNPRQLEEFIVMDTDIIRDQKLGAGAGMRSNKVRLCMCVCVFVCVWCCRTDCIIGEHCFSFGSEINSEPLHYSWACMRDSSQSDRNTQECLFGWCREWGL